MYRSISFRAASDFLYRLQYIIDHPKEFLQTDNGSEFANYFERAAEKLSIERYFSRVKTPKDNPEVERFHETEDVEWLYDGNLILDCDEFNKNLTQWLIEYNFN
jgi:transposase InsO family protein